MSQRTVTLHRGEIRAGANPGGGAVFTVVLRSEEEKSDA